MKFSIKLPPPPSSDYDVAEEGAIKDGIKKGLDRAKAWADKENEKYYKAHGINQNKPAPKETIKHDFPNATAVADWVIAHPEEKDQRVEYTVMVSGVKYPLHFQNGVLKEEYRESMIKAITNLPTNLPRVRKDAYDIFAQSYVMDNLMERAPKGSPKPVQVPFQSISKLIPYLMIGNDKGGKVFLRYYFDIDDFFDNVYDSDDEIGIDCREGKFDSNSSFEWIN